MTRYDYLIETGNDEWPTTVEFYPTDTGDWVRWEDAEQLLAENKYLHDQLASCTCGDDL